MKNKKDIEMKEQTAETPEKEVGKNSEMTEEHTEMPAEDSVPVEETDTLAAENEQLKAQVEQLKKDYLLARADLENFRKRTLKEKADLIRNGGESCLKDILPVIDDFERGLQAVGESADVEAVKQGIELIYNKFKTFLDRHGVKEIPTQDADFDTEYHEAVTTFPAPTPEQKGKVIDCVQKGYTMNDKVIRFAKVVVGE
ncbi:MAG TPA: nucleotide exchange factor GrpE [Candidatus Caccoplasma intestinavium]|uniref:Protein GrpE n=1 Tax=Candidatus Caccoplasma intestinavium TaxID=2840716 RepID=A0A9D1GCN2_9BACT|nr:nucleotide exchange factor GrpE [Candidatus Caccoplasma intestinavium]